MRTVAVQKKSEFKVAGSRLNTVPSIFTVGIVTPIESPTIQRKTSCACGGGCSKCRENAFTIQPKLKTSHPNDPYEQEADRVADQMMHLKGTSFEARMSEPSLQRQAKDDEEKPIDVRRMLSSSERLSQTIGLPTQIGSFNGHGQPLSNNTRIFFEPRMGYDLGQVRIHTGSKAANAAESVQAKAFTVGKNIVFGSNQYQPDSNDGKKLLAHELAHTVQQSTTRDTVYRIPQQLSAGPGASPSPGTGTTVVNTSSGPMPRAEFERRMRTKFGVNRVRTGTHIEQNTRVGTTIPASQWQSWNPGSSSEVYRFIFDAFDDFAWAFGGVPNVNEIVFFHTYFENQNGTATANSDVGASYGAGQLTIYNNTSSSARMGLPYARSVAGATYPGAPGIRMVGTGSTPGAPIGYPNNKQAVKRVIWHELGHGLAEAASNQCGTSAAPDPNMLRDYMSAIGWHNGHLHDIGNASVAAALAAGIMPAAGTEITGNDWNHPQWSEQPISAYMVSAPGEDFAEAVRAFVENPNLLFARSPERYRFVSTRVTALVRCLRQVQRPGDYPIPIDDGTRLA